MDNDDIKRSNFDTLTRILPTIIKYLFYFLKVMSLKLSQKCQTTIKRQQTMTKMKIFFEICKMIFEDCHVFCDVFDLNIEMLL